jgi:hypothetical protein
MEAALDEAVRTLSDELRLVRRELRSGSGGHGGAGGPETRHERDGAYGDDGRGDRGGDFVTRPSEYRDLPGGGGGRGGAEERIQALLTEDGTFVPYPERVNKPMAEIHWRPGEAEADAFILTGFLFSLDSRRLRLAYDVDHLDSGRYETINPARVHWVEGRRGQVSRPGKLRYVGT